MILESKTQPSFEQGSHVEMSSLGEVPFLPLDQTILFFFFTSMASMSFPPQTTLLYLGPSQIRAGSHIPENRDILSYSLLPVT
jgi:hypothetical protein